MRIERFQELAHAYGADLGRWPKNARIAAAKFLAEQPFARALLDEAAALDALLDTAPAAAPGGLLRERLIALAPRPYRPVWRRGATWISGAGLAAACVLGVMVGANASADLMADPVAETIVEASTVFDGTSYFDALENAG